MNTIQPLLVSSALLLMQGLMMTMKLWLTATVLSLCLGTLLGILRCQQLRSTGIATLLDGCTFVVRGVPIYVQLLITYFVLPDLLGINLPIFFAATLTLGLCSAAYVSQIVRSGINAIPIGQWEAAYVLGYSTAQTVRWIILPQMVRNILPALIGEFDQLLKSTSIVSSIGLLELTRVGMNIVAREMNPLTIYLAIALLYLMLSSALNALGAFLERKGTACS